MCLFICANVKEQLRTPIATYNKSKIGFWAVQFSSELNVLIVVLPLLVKMAISATFSFVYVYSMELFPTVVRNMGLGLGTIAGYIGAMAAPFISYIGESDQNMHVCVCVCLFVKKCVCVSHAFR